MTSSLVLAILKLQYEKVKISVKSKLMSKISSYGGSLCIRDLKGRLLLQQMEPLGRPIGTIVYSKASIA